MWLPNAAAVEEIHYSLARIFEKENDPISPVGIKSMDMLESACQRPHTGMGGANKYETLEAKLSALSHSLTKNHPFHNGNKRTAIVSVLTALYRNGKRLNTEVTDDDVYNFAVSVAADQFPTPEHQLDHDGVVAEMAKWLKRRVVSINSRAPGMKTRSFIDRCISAGAHCKNASGGAYVVTYKSRSIRISKSTRQMNGAVIQQYLAKLGLSEATAGISTAEFQEGRNGEREQIYRYMSALRRLAKT